VSLADIAARQQISLSYLEQLFARLRRKGLVKQRARARRRLSAGGRGQRDQHRRHRAGRGRAPARDPLRQASGGQGLHDRAASAA
jgi:hypothetical protein